MKSRKKPITPEAARLKMADLCSRSEQSTSDIVEKLRKMGLMAGDIKSIVEDLTDRQFIDDRRYARAYASDKLRFSGWGPFKIRMGLISKRISSDIITEAISELEPDVIWETILRVARSKERSLNLQLREDRLRLMRFLASRGFPVDLCKRAVMELVRTKENGGEA